MKYLVAIVAAFLCAAAVSAAPSSLNPTFEELALNPFAQFDEQLIDFAVDLQCIRDVISDELAKSDIADRWNTLKQEFDKLFNDEWKKCNAIENNREKIECRMKVIRKGADFLKEFMRTLARDYKEMFERIRTKIAEKCMKKDSYLDTRASLPDQFQCMVDILGKISKENGMEEEWTKTQPEFERRLTSWKKCPEAGNKIMVFICNIREGISTFKLMTEYLQKLAAQNPKLIQEFMQRAEQECQGKTTREEDFGLLFDDDEGKAGDRLKCIAEAIRDAVKETDWEDLGKKLRDELKAVGERMEACKSQQDKWEAFKCIRNELNQAREIIVKFMRSLKEANQKTWERIRDLIKERCTK